MAGRPVAPSWLAGLFRDRAELLGFVGLLAALNGFSDRLLTTVAQAGLGEALLGLGGISAVGWFAFYAIVAIAAKDGAAEPRRGCDLAVAGATVLLCVIPFALAAAVAVLLCGAYAVLLSEAGLRSRRIGVILLALTGPLLWGRILLHWFAPLLLGLDADLAALLAGTSVSGNVVQFIGINERFYIAPACSSLHNMSLAVLLWATLLQLLRLRLTPGLAAVGVAGALAMVLVNSVRLAAIASYPASFTYLHTGTGAQLFGWASLIAAAALIGGGILLVASPLRD